MRVKKTDRPLHRDYFVRALNVSYCVRGEMIPAVKHADLSFTRGEVTVVIGESGSGKTTIARALAGMLPPEQAAVTWAEAGLPSTIAFVQQEPHASLHPLVTVGEQIADCAAARFGRRTRRRRAAEQAREKALSLLGDLGLSPPGRFYGRYPHTLSGGQAQRAVLARALAMEAELLVADEPTSQLDLVTQAEAVRLIDLLASRGLAVCYITHDLSIAAEIGDRVAVLYRGEIVEHAHVRQVWDHPAHEYTGRLLSEMSG